MAPGLLPPILLLLFMLVPLVAYKRLENEHCHEMSAYCLASVEELLKLSHLGHHCLLKVGFGVARSVAAVIVHSAHPSAHIRVHAHVIVHHIVVRPAHVVIHHHVVVHHVVGAHVATTRVVVHSHIVHHAIRAHVTTAHHVVVHVHVSAHVIHIVHVHVVHAHVGAHIIHVHVVHIHVIHVVHVGAAHVRAHVVEAHIVHAHSHVSVHIIHPHMVHVAHSHVVHAHVIHSHVAHTHVRPRSHWRHHAHPWAHRSFAVVVVSAIVVSLPVPSASPLVVLTTLFIIPLVSVYFRLSSAILC